LAEAAEKLKVVAYLPGCQFEIIELSAGMATTQPLSCRPLPSIQVRGQITNLDLLAVSPLPSRFRIWRNGQRLSSVVWIGFAQRSSCRQYLSNPTVHSGFCFVPGSFIAMGPNIKQGVRLMGFQATVLDIAPTILHLYGIHSLVR
jgi:hypothetical protein